MVRRQHQVHLLRRRRRTVPGQHLAAVAAAAQVGHRVRRVQVVATGLLLVVVIAVAAVVQPAEPAGRRRVRQVGHVVQGRVEGVFPERGGKSCYLCVFFLLRITDTHLKLLDPTPPSAPAVPFGFCCRASAFVIVCSAFCGFSSLCSIVLLPVIWDRILGSPASDDDTVELLELAPPPTPPPPAAECGEL